MEAECGIVTVVVGDVVQGWSLHFCSCICYYHCSLGSTDCGCFLNNFMVHFYVVAAKHNIV